MSYALNLLKFNKPLKLFLIVIFFDNSGKNRQTSEVMTDSNIAIAANFIIIRRVDIGKLFSDFFVMFYAYRYKFFSNR